MVSSWIRTACTRNSLSKPALKVPSWIRTAYTRNSLSKPALKVNTLQTSLVMCMASTFLCICPHLLCSPLFLSLDMFFGSCSYLALIFCGQVDLQGDLLSPVVVTQ